MAVRKIQSAENVLKVFEQLAEHQPIGVSELGRLMGEPKAAVQRALVTLAECRWIRMAPGKPTRWELSERIHAIAYRGQRHSSLRQRARSVLARLRDETCETAVLSVPEVERFVIVEAYESQQPVRTSAAAGMVIPVRDSASGLAFLAHLDATGQAALLGEAPDAALLAQIAEVRARGYALNDEALVTGSFNVGVAVLDERDQPIAVVIIAAPSDRTSGEARLRMGALALKAAEVLSHRSYE